MTIKNRLVAASCLLVVTMVMGCGGGDVEPPEVSIDATPYLLKAAPVEALEVAAVHQSVDDTREVVVVGKLVLLTGAPGMRIHLQHRMLPRNKTGEIKVPLPRHPAAKQQAEGDGTRARRRSQPPETATRCMTPRVAGLAEGRALRMMTHQFQILTPPPSSGALASRNYPSP